MTGATILAKTRRLVVTGEPGDGSAAARQFDAVALCAGFKRSRDLLERLSGRYQHSYASMLAAHDELIPAG